MLPALTWDQFGSNDCSLWLMVQKKAQITTRVTKLLLEMPKVLWKLCQICVLGPWNIKRHAPPVCLKLTLGFHDLESDHSPGASLLVNVHKVLKPRTNLSAPHLTSNSEGTGNEVSPWALSVVIVLKSQIKYSFCLTWLSPSKENRILHHNSIHGHSQMLSEGQ